MSPSIAKVGAIERGVIGAPIILDGVLWLLQQTDAIHSANAFWPITAMVIGGSTSIRGIYRTRHGSP